MLLQERLRNYRLLLASASPRRRQLLSEAGFVYELAQPYRVEETYPALLPAGEVPRYLARLKSAAYPEQLLPGEILLTADTVVCLGDAVLGKPCDAPEAVHMLRNLSGRRHEVVTGVTIRSAVAERSFAVQSSVFFRTLTQEEIVYYVEHYHPYDKAGAYGIQEWIGYVAIEGVEGSFYNVMGLPVQQLYRELELFLAGTE